MPSWSDPLTPPAPKGYAIPGGRGRFSDLTKPFSEIQDQMAQVQGENAQALHANRVAQVAETFAKNDAEYLYNPDTRQWGVVDANGEIQIIEDTPANIFAMASNKDAQRIPGQLIPRGWQGVNRADLQSFVNGLDPESDFWGSLGSSYQSGLGLAVSAVDSMFGNDDPSNSWSRAKQEHQDNQTLGEYKAGQNVWSSGAGFMTGLGDTLGNIGSAATVAAPLLLTGAGAPVGFGVAGALMAGGEQVTDAYDANLKAFAAMDEQQLYDASPRYAQLRQSGMDRQEATQQIAIEGARVAGGTAALWGGAEGAVGGALGRSGMARWLGMGKGGGPVTAANATLAGKVAEKLGPLGNNMATRFSLRAGTGAVASGTQEIMETGLSQAANAAYTGIGSTDPRDYMTQQEFNAAAQSGFLLNGLFGGSRGAQANVPDAAIPETPDEQRLLGYTPERAIPQLEMQQRGLRTTDYYGSRGWTWGNNTAQDPNGIYDGEFSEVGLLDNNQRRLTNNQPSQRALTGPDGNIIDGEFTEVGLLGNNQPQRALPGPGQRRLGMWDGRDSGGGSDLAAAMGGANAYQSDMFAGDIIQPDMFGFSRPSTPAPPDAPAPDAPAPDAPAPTQPDLFNQPNVQDDLFQPGAQPQLPLDAPPDAPTEATPDGRPMGVAPPPTQNPIPMDPRQAAASAATVEARQGVTPSTPEPTSDIAAQVSAMLSPESQRDTVFVAEGNEQQLYNALDQAGQAADNLEVEPVDGGVLVTTNPQVAEKARSGSWTDADTQQALGYSENKTLSSVNGVTVQATTPQGDVQAQQMATNTPEAIAQAETAVAAQAEPTAQVNVTTPQEAQGARMEGLASESVNDGPAVPTEPAPNAQTPAAPTNPAPAVGAKAQAAKETSKAKDAGKPKNKWETAEETAKRISKFSKKPTGQVLAFAEKNPEVKDYDKLDGEHEFHIENPQIGGLDLTSGHTNIKSLLESAKGIIAEARDAESRAFTERVTADRKGKTVVYEASDSGGATAAAGKKESSGKPPAPKAEAAKEVSASRSNKSETVAELEKRLKVATNLQDIMSGGVARNPELAHNMLRNGETIASLERKIAEAKGEKEPPKAAKAKEVAQKRETERKNSDAPQSAAPNANKTEAPKTAANDNADNTASTGRRGRPESTSELKSRAVSESSRTAEIADEEYANSKGKAGSVKVEPKPAFSALLKAPIIGLQNDHTVAGPATTVTGTRGSVVDLSTQTVNAELEAGLRAELGRKGSKAPTGRIAAALRAKLDALDAVRNQLVDLHWEAVERLRKKLLADPHTKSMANDFGNTAWDKESADRSVAGNNAKEGGRPAVSPLISVPVTRGEAIGFGKLLRRQARFARTGRLADLDVFRTMLAQVMPGVKWLSHRNARLADTARYSDDMMQDRRNLMQLAKEIANMSMQDINDFMGKLSKSHLLDNSTVIKMVMRGPTEVRLGIPEEDNTDTANRVRKQGSVKYYDGDIPNTKHVKVLSGWIDRLNKRNRMDGQPVLMSLDRARQLFPDSFGAAQGFGRYAKVGRTMEGMQMHVIAIDFDRITEQFGEHAEQMILEVMAHETGEYAARQIYNSSDAATQQSVRDAHSAWLSTVGENPAEAFASHATPMMAKMVMEGEFNNDLDYATRFSEWQANHIARHLLSKEPARGRVSQHFKKVAEAFKDLFSTGEYSANGSVADMVDRWISELRSHEVGPDAITTNYGDLDFGEGKKIPDAVRAAKVKAVTAGIKNGKDLFENINEKITASPKGKRDHATAVASSIFERIMESQPGGILRKVGLSLMSLDQMVLKFDNTPVGKHLRNYVRLDRAASQVAKIVMHGGKLMTPHGAKVDFKGINAAMDKVGNLSKGATRALNQVMLSSTTYGVYVGKTFEEQRHLSKGLSPDVIAKNYLRWKQVQDDWAALQKQDPAGAQIYHDMEKAFAELHKHTKDAIIDNVKNLYGPNPNKKQQDFIDDEVKRINELYAAHTEGPYFPLTRDGDWIVSATFPEKHLRIKDPANLSRVIRDVKALNPGAQVTVPRDSKTREPIKEEDGSIRISIKPQAVRFFKSEHAAKNGRQQIFDEVLEAFSLEGIDGATLDASASLDDDRPTVDRFVSFPKQKKQYMGELGNANEFVRQFRENVAARGGEVDPLVMRALEEAYVDFSPEMSPRRSLRNRQNIMGADENMVRGYTNRYRARAFEYSRILYGRQINSALNDIRTAKDENDVPFSPAEALHNNIVNNQKQVRDQMEDTIGNSVQRTALNLSSLAYLAASPVYVMMNAMQNQMVTIPILSGLQTRNGAIGIAKAERYLAAAYEGALPFFSKQGLQRIVSESRALAGMTTSEHSMGDIANALLDQFAPSKGGKANPERQMLEYLMEHNRLDFSFLSSIEDALSESDASRALSRVSRLGMAAAEQVETMNRVTAALASYRLAKQEMNMDHESAVQFAYDLVGQAHIDYGKSNRPSAFNVNGIRVMAQFKMYTQGMYALFARNAMMTFSRKLTSAQQEEVEAAPPSERAALTQKFVTQNRKQGAQTLMYLFGTHGAIGGAMGLGPLTAVAKMGLALVAAGMGRDDEGDEWKDPEQLLDERARYVFGDTLGKAAARGIPEAMFGLPLAERMGFPDLYDSRFVGIKDKDDAGTKTDKILLFAMGPVYSTIRRTNKGIGNALDDNPYTHGDDAAPAALRSLFRAHRYATDGLVDKNGNTLVPLQDMHWNDVTVQALGLTPGKVQDAYRDRSAVKGTTGRITEKRKAILRNYNGGEDVTADIKKFNDSVPKPFRITPQTLKDSAKAKAKYGEGTKDEKAVRGMLQ